MIVFLLISTITVILYTYIGFPLIVALVALIKQKHVAKDDISPSVSLIIAAFNEEKNIVSRLENALNSEYPNEQTQIIVASDGSTDRTVDLVRQYQKHNVLLLDLPRRGKIFALQQAVRRAHGDILVFSDANTLFHPKALRNLVRNFADPKVGGVCGNQMYGPVQDHDVSADGETLYWSIDKYLKSLESLTGSIVSADGAIYAIRKELFAMPEMTFVTDDFAISTAVIQKGFRLVFEPEAIAFEPVAGESGREFGRKVRIINRGLRGVILRKKLLNPLRFGFYSIILISHKILRRLVPLMLIAAYVFSVMTMHEHSVIFFFFILQSLFYALALLGFAFRKKTWGQFKALYIPFFFCLVNGAALVALMHILFGRQINNWVPQRT
ncbi:glycosyltransferase [candidate division KSB1 bacterium]|nr:glycosyltransferase [candidate division KSB1 bacterium]